MDYAPPDDTYRMVFARRGSSRSETAVAEQLWALFDLAKTWGTPYQLWAAHDIDFSVRAIDRYETLLSLLRASAIDWQGAPPPRAPTHRFAAFNRREDAEFADVYVCFRAEPDSDAPLYVRARFGVGPVTTDVALAERFRGALTVFRPGIAFVETPAQMPKALSESMTPEVGWATFVPRTLGQMPAVDATIRTIDIPDQGTVVLAPGKGFDADEAGRASRLAATAALLPFLRGLITAAPVPATRAKPIQTPS